MEANEVVRGKTEEVRLPPMIQVTVLFDPAQQKHLVQASLSRGHVRIVAITPQQPLKCDDPSVYVCVAEMEVDNQRLSKKESGAWLILQRSHKLKHVVVCDEQQILAVCDVEIGTWPAEKYASGSGVIVDG
jgi:hypothetical protein